MVTAFSPNEWRVAGIQIGIFIQGYTLQKNTLQGVTLYESCAKKMAKAMPSFHV